MQNTLWNEVLSFGAGPLCDMYMPEGCARQAFRVCRVAMACRTRMCDALGVSRVGVHTVNSALLNTFEIHGRAPLSQYSIFPHYEPRYEIFFSRYDNPLRHWHDKPITNFVTERVVVTTSLRSS